MADIVEAPEDENRIDRVAGEVLEMCDEFPAPGIPV
jgi:hypothetical protein